MTISLKHSRYVHFDFDEPSRSLATGRFPNYGVRDRAACALWINSVGVTSR